MELIYNSTSTYDSLFTSITLICASLVPIATLLCDKLHPYRNHMFELYTGKRHDDIKIKEDESNTARVHTIDDNGNGSPRVVGKVTGKTETASEGASGADSESCFTADSTSDDSESDTGAYETNPLSIITGVTAVVGVGAAGFFILKK